MTRTRGGLSMVWLVNLAALLAIGCGESFDRPERLPGWMVNDDSMGVPAQEVSMTGHFVRGDLLESSGVVASSTQPGVLFTINDSGNEPLLFATDSTGADRGVWRVTGATNDDWEAIADGPCENASQEQK